MFTRTAQPGLWFIAGSFAQCRIYSKAWRQRAKWSRSAVANPAAFFLGREVRAVGNGTPRLFVGRG
jgi:hypothetical protein